ncbi:MAG: hypothetical protein RRC34_08015 [Lentisphaeria bacterium]|nr:hypothetical protein [Lentisphaeria bacterium]
MMMNSASLSVFDHPQLSPMKLKTTLRNFLLAAGGLLLASTPALHAADGTWNVDANGTWSTPGMANQTKWNGRDCSGMWRVGQRIRRADGAEFDILASDVNMSFVASGGNTVSSHPDQGTGSLSYDWWAEGTVENGFLSTKSGGRGPCDYNFVREDGSAFLMERVAWDDSRLTRISYKMDNNSTNFETQRWTLLPSVGHVP